MAYLAGELTLEQALEETDAMVETILAAREEATPSSTARKSTPHMLSPALLWNTPLGGPGMKMG